MKKKPAKSKLGNSNQNGEALKRLAAKRVPKAIRAIELVGNLVVYHPEKEHVEKILKALYEAADSAKLKLQTGKREKGFEL